MKRIVVIVTAMLMSIPLVVYAQKSEEADPVLKLFNQYEEKEGVESVSISPALLGLMKGGKANDKKTQELISKITGLRILAIADSTDSRRRVNREAFTAELRAIVKADFEEIMKMKTANERIELYVRSKPDCKSNDCKSALLFIISANSSISATHLAGTVDKTLIDAVINGEISLSNK